MYPSPKNIRYGVFVKNFVVSLEDTFQIKKTVLTKKEGLNKLYGYIGFYLRIVKVMFNAKKEDLVYVHFPLHVAPILCLFNRKYILNFHGSDLIFNNTLKKFLSFFLKKLIKKSAIVLPSNYYRAFFLTQFEKEKENLFVYPSGGINRTIFNAATNVSKSGDFVIGFVSNFIEKKGWKILLNAIEILLKENSISNFSIRLVGDGPDKKEIKNKVEKLNISYTLKSNLTQSELAKEYNLFNVFVFPTYNESLGLVGLEALSCGVPVIASNVGGPKGYIKSGENGILFKVKDAKELSLKIKEYYNFNSELKSKMITNAINTAYEYDSRKVKSDIVSFLNTQ
jgi:glycosyltransferase involved in cell wall biosynthesis